MPNQGTGSPVNCIILRQGGSTSPTAVFYQYPWSSYCRLYWYSYDQEVKVVETVAVFKCKDWKKARQRAWKEYREFLKKQN